MPKYLISHVETVASTYVVDAPTEKDAESVLSFFLQPDQYNILDLRHRAVVEEYYQSEGELKD